MKMKKVYDIMITEGEDKGRYRQMGIDTREHAEQLKAMYWESTCEIVEREEKDTTIDLDSLLD